MKRKKSTSPIRKRRVKDGRTMIILELLNGNVVVFLAQEKVM